MDASLRSGNVNRPHVVRWRSSGSALLGTNVVPRKQIRSDKAVDIPPTGTVSPCAAALQLGVLDPASNLSFPLCYTCITHALVEIDRRHLTGSEQWLAIRRPGALGGWCGHAGLPLHSVTSLFHPAFNLLARCMD